MSKNYDLYPASERKIDNWRRRILGYEKMKRDMQRQIQILKNKNKKQKEVIDKSIDFIKNGDLLYLANKNSIVYRNNIEIRAVADRLNDLLQILQDKEVE